MHALRFAVMSELLFCVLKLFIFYMLVEDWYFKLFKLKRFTSCNSGYLNAVKRSTIGFNTVYHGLPSKTVKKVRLCSLIILGRSW